MALPTFGQLWSGADRGLNIALVSALGNRFQRIGVTVQGYYCHGLAQVNAEVRVYHNFRNLGPRGQYNELVASAGVLAGYGAQRNERNRFMSVVSNHTGYRNSVGYSYNLYFTPIQTTQQTGTLAFQFGDVSIITENDILARPMLDRFRTGAFLVQYQYKDLYQLAINCTMWTGQMGNKVMDDKSFPYRGYMDATDGVYTNYSHGLLSAQAKVALSYGQTVQANAGVDAEQVRNFVQNRLIHDMIFIPKRILQTKNCHIPMLDTAGAPYLYREGQVVRPAKVYYNAFTGAGVFY